MKTAPYPACETCRCHITFGFPRWSQCPCFGGRILNDDGSFARFVDHAAYEAHLDESRGLVDTIIDLARAVDAIGVDWDSLPERIQILLIQPRTKVDLSRGLDDPSARTGHYDAIDNRAAEIEAMLA